VIVDGVSVLFVCHANRCRSPMAERLAEVALARRLRLPAAVCAWPGVAGISFASAGTHAFPGDPMHRRGLHVLEEYGASGRQFFSQRVAESLLHSAGLILTATRDQRAHCVRMAPAAVRRTFTLREFGRLCRAVDVAELPTVPGVPLVPAPPATRLLSLVSAATAARAQFRPVPARADDLPDPVNRSVDHFRACAREIWSILDVITGLLIAVPPAPEPARSPRARTPAG